MSKQYGELKNKKIKRKKVDKISHFIRRIDLEVAWLEYRFSIFDWSLLVQFAKTLTVFKTRAINC